MQQPYRTPATPNAKNLSGPERIEDTIADGRKVSILARPKAKHMLAAQRIVAGANGGSDAALSYANGLALVAVLVQIEGEFLTYEALNEEDLVVTNELISKLPLSVKKEPSANAT